MERMREERKTDGRKKTMSEDNRRAKRSYSEEFKKQMVQLLESGKTKADILREYDLTRSALDGWVKRIQATGSSKAKDNRTAEEVEMLRLRKENQRLLMENDILKQAALIFAQRSK